MAGNGATNERWRWKQVSQYLMKSSEQMPAHPVLVCKFQIAGAKATRQVAQRTDNASLVQIWVCTARGHVATAQMCPKVFALTTYGAWGARS
jgi:hypothetical protein